MGKAAPGRIAFVQSCWHRDIVDRIAAGLPTAAGRALYDHVMASRERMHRAVAVATAIAPLRPTARKSR